MVRHLHHQLNAALAHGANLFLQDAEGLRIGIFGAQLCDPVDGVVEPFPPERDLFFTRLKVSQPDDYDAQMLWMVPGTVIRLGSMAKYGIAKKEA